MEFILLFTIMSTCHCSWFRLNQESQKRLPTPKLGQVFLISLFISFVCLFVSISSL